MEWVFLGCAVLFESFAIITMKLTPAFNSLLFGSLILSFFLLSFYLESIAIKKIDLTLAYSIWVGSGIIFITAIDYFYLKAQINLIGFLSLFGIIICLFVFSIYGYNK